MGYGTSARFITVSNGERDASRAWAWARVMGLGWCGRFSAGNSGQSAGVAYARVCDGVRADRNYASPNARAGARRGVLKGFPARCVMGFEFLEAFTRKGFRGS